MLNEHDIGMTGPEVHDEEQSPNAICSTTTDQHQRTYSNRNEPLLAGHSRPAHMRLRLPPVRHGVCLIVQHCRPDYSWTPLALSSLFAAATAFTLPFPLHSHTRMYTHTQTRNHSQCSHLPGYPHSGPLTHRCACLQTRPEHHGPHARPIHQAVHLRHRRCHGDIDGVHPNPEASNICADH